MTTQELATVKYASTPVREAVLVADLLGHADLSTLVIYTQPNDDDREHALALLTTDA